MLALDWRKCRCFRTVKLARVAGLYSQIWRTTWGLRPAVRETTGVWTCPATTHRDDSMSLIDFSPHS
jgi:hypothetical protein